MPSTITMLAQCCLSKALIYFIKEIKKGGKRKSKTRKRVSNPGAEKGRE